MELEELKASWNILNEQLANSEMLNKRIIKEMITNRTQSAYDRLFRFDLFGLILVLGLCIVFPILVTTGKIVLKPLSFALLEGSVAIGLFMQLFFFSVLLRFDMEKKKICELTKLVLTYKLWMKRNTVIGSWIGMAALIAFLFIEKARLVGNWEMRLTGAFILASVVMFFQTRFYLKNIRAVEKGLSELKEFEEEPDQNKSA